MAYQCLVGPSAFDVVAYVRSRMGDLATGQAQVISDAQYQAFVPAVAMEFSRWKPLGDFHLPGQTVAPDYTSPLNTVQYQQRYYLQGPNAPAALQSMTPSIMSVNEVLYRVGQQIMAGADLALFLLIPFSNIFRFTLDPAEPSSRVIRSNFFNELDHYGIGYFEQGRDGSGNFFVDIFPVPETTGLPILVSYRAAHTATAQDDGFGSVSYPTIEDRHAKLFGDLLYALLLENEAERLSLTQTVVGGMGRRQNRPDNMLKIAQVIRGNVELALGAATPSATRYN